MKLAVAVWVLPAIAFAQSATTGAVRGVVADGKTGEPLVGATVVASSPALQGEQTALTDEHGRYQITELPPGAYEVTFFYEATTIARTAKVVVGRGTVLDVRLDPQPEKVAVTTLPEHGREVICANGSFTYSNDCGDLRLPPPPRSGPQIQADLGLAVIGLAYEQPIGEHYAIQVEAQAFSTYFAPWFSAGDRVDGFGGQLRPTWFRNASHHGLYVAPYVRVDRVTHDMAAGVGFAAGGFAGYALPVGPLDIRVGGGAQYMRYFAGPFGLSTPFVALDLVVGYRL